MLELSRRRFLITGLTAAGGLMLELRTGAARAEGEPPGVSAYIEIRPDNTVIIGAPNPEMGQGVKTALPMLVAEELGVPWRSIQVRQLNLGLRRTDEGMERRYGGQGSGGSWSVHSRWEELRRAGAIARDLLMRAAAARWDTSIETLELVDGHVEGADGRRAALAELVAEAARLTPREDIELKPADQFRIIGKPAPDVDAAKIATGQVKYAIDHGYEGALAATIIHCPYFDGAVKSIDDSGARSVPGYRRCVELKRPDETNPFLMLANAVAVVADKTWQAFKAAGNVKVEWTRGSHPDESSDALYRQARAALDAGGGKVVREDASVAVALERADRTIEAEYALPYVSHCPMEPQNCIADARGDRITIIGPIQMPLSAHRMLHHVLGIPEDRIDIRLPRLGGGFGRRLSSDHVMEAALLSRALQRPVKLIWSRTEDLQHDFYRPGGVHRLTAGLKNGAISAWRHRMASPSKYYRRPGMPEDDYWKSEFFPDDFPAALVPALTLEWFGLDSGAIRGSWRAPASTANAFVVQSFLDEVAEAAGQDPLELRLKMLEPGRELPYGNHGGPVWNTGRLADVLKRAADEAGWSQRSKNRPMGIAGHFTFGSYVAYVVEMGRVGERLRVARVTGAIDCGQVVNPLGVRKQIEGGVVDAMSAGIGQEIRIENGRVTSRNFDDYPLLRIDASPQAVDVHIVKSSAPPSGVGEPPLPPLTPAYANAVYAATGVRMRQQPFARHYPELFG